MQRLSILNTFWWLMLVLGLLPGHAQVSDFASTDFARADSMASLYPRHPLIKPEQLSHSLTDGLATEHEKFRAIYKWVANNIDNDYTLSQQNQRMRKKVKDAAALQRWNASFRRKVFQTLVKRHRSVCTGYALLIATLATHAGITCEVVHGYGRTVQSNVGGEGYVNHSWNAVLLHGKWYLCDATWSSGAIDLQRRTFVRRYEDAYFLMDPAMFVRNHYPVDTTWLLMKDVPSLHDFLHRTLVYVHGLHEQILPESPDTFAICAKAGEKIEFKLSHRPGATVEGLMLQLRRASMVETRSLTVYEVDQTHAAFDHVFHSKGNYLVDVLWQASPLCTYNVHVE